MAPIVSKTVIARARRHINTAMKETATNLRTGTTVKCFVVIEGRPVLMKDVPAHLRLRRWNIVMPAPSAPLSGGADNVTGDRLAVTTEDGSPRGTFLVTELTGPDTYNVSTTVLAVLSNATVSFKRGAAVISDIDVFVERLSDEERSFGINFDWRVWFDASVRYPSGTAGGLIVSKMDTMTWSRSPNPLAKGGNVVLDAPRYAYFEDAIAYALFKEEGP